MTVGDASRRRFRPRSSLERLREPEVEHLDRAVGPDLDVGRLQIAMDDALLVRGFERLGDLPRDGQRFVERKASARDALGEGRRPRPVPSRGPCTPRLSSRP